MCVASSVVFYKVIVFANADFKDHKVTYITNNNVKNIGKSIGVKVSPILFTKVSVSVAAILLTYNIGIVIGNTFNKYR